MANKDDVLEASVTESGMASLDFPEGLKNVEKSERVSTRLEVDENHDDTQTRVACKGMIVDH
jgi:hypothetical protein